MLPASAPINLRLSKEIPPKTRQSSRDEATIATRIYTTNQINDKSNRCIIEHGEEGYCVFGHHTIIGIHYGCQCCVYFPSLEDSGVACGRAVATLCFPCRLLSACGLGMLGCLLDLSVLVGYNVCKRDKYKFSSNSWNVHAEYRQTEDYWIEQYAYDPDKNRWRSAWIKTGSRVLWDDSSTKVELDSLSNLWFATCCVTASQGRLLSLFACYGDFETVENETNQEAVNVDADDSNTNT